MQLYSSGTSLQTRSNAPAVVGKSFDSVVPAMCASPAPSSDASKP
jgi:hypothetical protein